MIAALYVSTVLEILTVVLGAKVKVSSRIYLFVICRISIVIVDSSILSVSALIYLGIIIGSRYTVVTV